MKKYSLSMVATAFNEEELIESFIEKSIKDLSRVSDDFEVVLVNDGSTDRTLPIAKSLAGKYPQLKIVNLEKNAGTGANYIPGFKAASKEIVFNNTVDAFFDTQDLPGILPYLDEYDAVSGCRSDLKANNLYQKMLTLINYYLIKVLFRVNLRAFQTLQFHRRSFFDEIEIEARSSFLSPELLLKALKSGRSLKEVEITFHPRKQGTPKGGKLSSVVRSLKDVLGFWCKWKILNRW
ncbi:MAG: glycosyltransferase family 2 protein [Armatimonadota bacterium]